MKAVEASFKVVMSSERYLWALEGGVSIRRHSRGRLLECEVSFVHIFMCYARPCARMRETKSRYIYVTHLGGVPMNKYF